MGQNLPLATTASEPTKPNSRALVKLLIRTLILLAVIWGIWHFVSTAREDLAAEKFNWRRVEPSWLVLSGFFYALGLMPACWFWQRILIALDQKPKPLETARAYFIGHLGKYVPGKALVVVMRTALIRSPRVDTTVAATSVFIETLTMMAVGACVAAVILVFRSPDWRLVVLAVGLMLSAGIPTWPPLFRWLVTKLQVRRANAQIEDLLHGIDFRLMFQGWLSLTVGWVLLGLSLWAVMQAIPEVDQSGLELLPDLPLFTACVSLALVAGFLSLLPGGVLVRELVVMTLIAADPKYGPLVAIVSAVLLRLTWLISELFVSGILYIGCRVSPRAATANVTECVTPGKKTDR